SAARSGRFPNIVWGCNSPLSLLWGTGAPLGRAGDEYLLRDLSVWRCPFCSAGARATVQRTRDDGRHSGHRGGCEHTGVCLVRPPLLGACARRTIQQDAVDRHDTLSARTLLCPAPLPLTPGCPYLQLAHSGLAAVLVRTIDDRLSGGGARLRQGN